MVNFLRGICCLAVFWGVDILWGFIPTMSHPSAIPLGGIALPLGDHLLPATIEKILHGEFVDLFSLLYRELEKKDKDQLDDREKDILKRRKFDRTLAIWLLGFLIYVNVIATHNLWRSMAVFQYVDIIYKSFSHFIGAFWHRYGGEFHMRAATNPSLSWDQVHPQLCL